MATGICNAIYTCDDNGAYANPPWPPSDPKATDLFFDINTKSQSPPQDQLDFKRDIERAVFAIKKLFIRDGKQDPKFRPYYVQFYNLSSLGLVGADASPDVARRAFETVTTELIDGEGPAVKQAHLGRLAGVALGLSAICLVAYGFLRVAGDSVFMLTLLTRLDIAPLQASGFMMLWVGCFVGVVLSYGWRTTKMTVGDLVVTDSDYLSPLTRHLFAGTLTMLMGILLCRGVFEVKLAGISSAHIMDDPMVALLTGSLFGISELLLPGEVVKRAGALFGLKVT